MEEKAYLDSSLGKLLGTGALLHALDNTIRRMISLWLYCNIVVRFRETYPTATKLQEKGQRLVK